MMKLVLAPDVQLETPVVPFDFENLNPHAIAEEMIELMLREGGLGLAANQVGLNAQVFVMKPILEKTGPFAVFNPIIAGLSKETELGPEGCLSHPGLFLKVKRPISCIVEFLDVNQEKKRLKLNDIDARIFLHEYDHLYGIQYIDRVSKLKYKFAEKKRLKKEKMNG